MRTVEWRVANHSNTEPTSNAKARGVGERGSGIDGERLIVVNEAGAQFEIPAPIFSGVAVARAEQALDHGAFFAVAAARRKHVHV